MLIYNRVLQLFVPFGHGKWTAKERTAAIRWHTTARVRLCDRFQQSLSGPNALIVFSDYQRTRTHVSLDKDARYNRWGLAERWPYLKSGGCNIIGTKGAMPEATFLKPTSNRLPAHRDLVRHRARWSQPAEPILRFSTTR
jgi:hypothetical protein